MALPGAVSLARALLTLSRSEQSGVLHVSSSSERFQLVFDAGVVRALRGGVADRHVLGDELLAAGALDSARYAAALAAGTPTAPIGEWLVRTGSTTSAALQYVLRHQMRDRVKRILLSKSLDYHFGRQDVVPDASWLEAPFAAADLVLFGLRELFVDRHIARDVAAWSRGTLSLSALGRSLVEGATLWPEELAVVELLRQGTTVRGIRDALGPRVRGLRFLVALHVLGAISVGETRDAQYGALLRKLRQARQSAGASTLLDLPSFATGAEARRALRKLAGQFHPDTLGPHAAPELRAASHEVMAALNAAEQRMRGSGLRR